MSAIQRFLSKLDKVRSTGTDRYIACCPSHRDKSPSLSVTYKNGKVLMHCHSHGCSPLAILSAVGLEMQDLFDENRHDYVEFSDTDRRQRNMASKQNHLIERAVMRIAITRSWVEEGKELTVEEATKFNNAYQYLEAHQMLGEIKTTFGEFSI
jgi:hypothetical protein